MAENDKGGCFYIVLQILEKLGILLFALLYIFSGPNGGIDDGDFLD